MGIKIIRGLEGVKKTWPNLVLTIGNFDGVHIGHQRIMGKVIEAARETGGSSMAMSFDPHPIKVLSPEKAPSLMTPPEEKARIMGHLGIERLLLINFNREFAGLEPDDFIRRVLVEKLHPVWIVVGHNYAFGRAKKGTTDLLRNRGRKYGFRLTVVRNVRMKGQVVSSSRIRGLLEKGKVYEASALLGRAYMIEGKVEKGAGRGSKLLGYPTANILSPHELIPKEGVYAIKTKLAGKMYDAVMNIGTNPTFNGGRLSPEVHIMNFKGDILGQDLAVYFVKRIRDEKKFSSAEALKAAIKEDVDEARRVLGAARDIKLI
ncbi:MAG: bifunctional riboflavin kinase/FAD synthetase [Nitrospiraceae bacterium]|nr:bifunctional riboflavin kinase/FAD synthetase [Nitrospiraceae bacterium]